MMDRDREFLFGLFAAQLKGISPGEMIFAAAAWAADPSISLAQRLVDQNLLAVRDRELLERLVDETIRVHDGDAAQALCSFGGEKRIQEVLPDMFTPAELDAMDTVPMSEADFSLGSASEIAEMEEAPGRYTFISQHAKGGMGHVLLVHDEYLGRSVALKELLPASTDAESGESDTPIRHTTSLVARFLQEARVTGQLEHPAIVPVYEVGRRKDGSPYYTMRLVRGKTLSRALRDCQGLSERLALLPNFIDLCQAIAYAHSRGVIHRDIKPGNVMVGQFGETVVLDWGLAKVRETEDVNAEDIERILQTLNIDDEAAEPNTLSGRALGTPNYMPPEQAEGRLDAIDERSDVFSLGAVLYEILTGSPPYPGKSVREVLDNVINSRPLPVLETAPHAPPELAGICEKALQHAPDDRYQSAIELSEDTQRFVTGSMVRAYQYSVRDILWRYYKKHMAVVNTVLACVLALMAVGIWSYISVLHARNLEHEQRLVAEDAQKNEETARQEAEHARYLTQLALMQEYIGSQDFAMANKTAADVLPAQRGWEWGLLVNRANTELLTVTGFQEAVASVTCNPDGTLAATTSPGGLIQTWDLTSGTLRTTFENTASWPAASPQFSPDGTRLVMAGGDDNVRVWDVASGKLVHKLAGHTPKAIYAEFAKDNTLIISCALDGTTKLWDANTGAIAGTVQSDASTELGKAMFSPDAVAFVTVSDLGGVRVWNREDLTERFRCSGANVVFNGDGKLLAVAEGGNIFILDAVSGSRLYHLKGEGEVRRLRFSRNSSQLLSAASDGKARLWNVHTGDLTGEYPHGSLLDNVSFARDDSVVIACGRDNTFSVWETRTGFLLNRLSGRGRFFWMADFGLDGNRMVTTVSEPFFQIWDPMYQTGRRLLNYGPGPTDLALCEKAGLAATFCSNGLELAALDGKGKPVVYVRPSMLLGGGEHAAFSSDGARMAVILDPCVPMVWDFAVQDFVQLSGHCGSVLDVAFDPSGQRIATASQDTTARVWDALSGRSVLRLEGHEGDVKSAEFSPDGQRILTASSDGTARIWDAESGMCQYVLKGHRAGVNDGVFTADGARIFTASDDGTIREWDVRTGAALRVLQGHGGAVYEITLATDHLMLTSSSDGTTRLWDETGMELRSEFPGVYEARYLPASSELITVSNDGRTECWGAAPWCVAGMQDPFDQYRAEDYGQAKGQLVPDRTPEQIIAVSSDQILARFLTLLIETLQRDTGIPSSPAVKALTPETGFVADGLALLGLDASDIIVEVAGASLDDHAAAQSRLQKAVSELQARPVGKLDMVVVRQGSRIPVHIMTRPRQEYVNTVSLSQEEALRVIGEISKGLNDTAVSADRAGEAALQQAGMGLLLSMSQLELPLLLKANLAPYDRLVKIDGAALADYQDARERLNGLRGHVENQKGGTFSLDIQRGSFIRVHLEYEMK